VLLLVRHAMPLVNEAAPPATWPLSAHGKQAARRIGSLIPAHASLVSSTEMKAHDTLVYATGRTVITDARLNEVNRPPDPFGSDWREQRLRYVAGKPPPGWEPPEQVAARVDEVIQTHATAGVPLVLAGHGLAFTVWLSSHGLIDSPAAFWSGLRLPDILLAGAGEVRSLLKP
jgi:broad specificity phosphatase PhoE